MTIEFNYVLTQAWTVRKRSHYIISIVCDQAADGNRSKNNRNIIPRTYSYTATLCKFYSESNC